MNPAKFRGIKNIENKDCSEDEVSVAAADCTKNPNREDNRRLYQIRNIYLFFFWDPSIKYENQPNRLAEYGPTELVFPDHFLEVTGAIVLIY